MNPRALPAAVLLAAALLVAGCTPRPEAPPSVETVSERGPIRFTTIAAPTTALIADPIRIVARVEAPPEFVFQFPDATAFGEITATRQTDPPSVLVVNEQTQRWEVAYTLESYAAGKLEIPPLVVKYGRKPDAGAPPNFESELAGQSLAVEIRSALTSQDSVQKPRDITGLLAVPWRPLKPWEIAALIGGSLAAILLGWWAFRAIRRRMLAPPPPVAPEVWALRELGALERADLLARGEVREFYYRLSEIIRTYIERKFGLAAPEMTTEEFLTRLSRDAASLPYDSGKLRLFLESCDLVKYAAWTPTRGDGDAALSAGRVFVDATAAAWSQLHPAGVASTTPRRKDRAA